MNKKFRVLVLVLPLFLLSCKDLTELNVNTNGVQPSVVNPNLVFPTVVTETAKAFVNLGYMNIAGVVQHTQKDAWSSEHNDYDWGGSQDWRPYYKILVNNKLVYDRATELGYEFHQGASLVMKAMLFGLITDLWGDAPYTGAIKGDEGMENLQPQFDTQEFIYDAIIADLEAANTLLSKNKGDYVGIDGNVDVLYEGDPAAWRKLANSLLLRYYMRISVKKAAVAKAGIEKIVANPSQYPLITSADEDAAMPFTGNSPDTSWPASTAFDPSESNYKRIKMAATLVERLQEINDPRLGVWAQKVEIPLEVSAAFPAGTDEIVEVNGKKVRHLSPDKVGTTQIDTDPEYVGLPTSFSALPSAYNLNPTPGQTSNNPHVSFLNEMYKEPAGDLLKARLVSAAEVHFILAEAALKGWAAGDAEEHYNAAIEASFETWGVSDDLGDYMAGADVAYNGTLEQIIEQKWIASWTAATEAWFDYRRTGLPDLKAGPAAKRDVLPVRFYYVKEELLLNESNTMSAIDKLEITGYSQADAKNSAWSKPWLLQGTGKPWN
ncbi:SusD/RagB family nutrient-binding outer membrane lipoprotein [Chryseolinea lacunae]|uniref:SusD/RagB family nutrient-binding outer membrane lipoprotein n=1 Tax=Chryseolinea lacunae TaxID=2801331 RepID=A0ABS1KK99_9BACT|nr:SusD/RagB family nutrient-binding outer membrane lipoprotein [Chryseolinea lacunae]MBL0739652.1 SusD/RagB family nutrient-binding outer membrane lipoprotein [Chryseolinea lacunae]